MTLLNDLSSPASAPAAPVENSVGTQQQPHKPLIPRLLTSSLKPPDTHPASGNTSPRSALSSNKTSAFFSDSPTMPLVSSSALPDSYDELEVSDRSLHQRHTSDTVYKSPVTSVALDTDRYIRASDHVARRLAGGALSGQVSPSPTSASSVSSRRNWDDFEGKPLVALPSPMVGSEETRDAFARLIPAATKGESSRQSSLRFEDSAAVEEKQRNSGRVSRTMAFFTKGTTTAPPVRPPFTTTSSANDVKAAPRKLQESTGGGWLSTNSSPIKRLPSVPIEDGRALTASAIQNRDSLPEVRASQPRSTSGQTTSSHQGEASMDADTNFASTIPSFASGPSISSSRSESEQLLFDPNASLSTSSSSSAEDKDTLAPSISFVSVPAARTSGNRRSSNSRHTSGPSENASGSSLFPPLLRQLHRDSESSHPDGLPLTDRSDASSTSVSEPALASVEQESPASGSTSTLQSMTMSPVSGVDALEEEDEDTGTVGPYRIERTLGHGAFSRVVLARRIRRRTIVESNGIVGNKSRSRTTEDETLVALKMMERVPYSQSERMRVSWVREVEVLKHISHPCLVRFMASFSTPRHHVLVLERVGGGELFDLLAKHQLELARREWLVRRIVAELTNAIGWMHSINLVHRDIKLENIILTRSCFDQSALGGPLRPSLLGPIPLVKITDFGLSRFVDPAGPLLETRCGSEEYAAPELIIGKKYDGRCTDVWALGVVTYALLTGALPFLEDDEVAARGGLDESREGAHVAERDARQRKAHLLRIAKGDLRWPTRTNERSTDLPTPNECPASNRLITPCARALVARLLRRDPTKRTTAWDALEDTWFVHGSFGGGDRESSALSEQTQMPLQPTSPEGAAWLEEHAGVIGGAVGAVARYD